MIHLNGDSRETLVREWQNFIRALEAAQKAFPHSSFHGRNHYPKEGLDPVQDAIGAGGEIYSSLGSIKKLAEQVLAEIIFK